MLQYTNIINSYAGFIHVFSAVIALVLGILVLLKQKGTRRHKFLGYIYFFCMLLMNGTAFMIYGLYGTFGIFHVFAIISLMTIICGIIPIVRKRKNVTTHFSFMYWSVVGLYAAFAAEIFTRLPGIVLNADGTPNTVFYRYTGLGVAIVMVTGIYVFIKLRPRWRRL